MGAARERRVSVVLWGMLSACACTVPPNGEVQVAGHRTDGGDAAPLQDASPHPVVVTDRVEIRALAVAGGTLFWAEENGVFALSASAVTPQQISPIPHPTLLAAGGRSLFFNGRESSGPVVRRAELPNPAEFPRRVVLNEETGALATTADGATLVFSAPGRAGGLHQVAVDGSARQTLSSGREVGKLIVHEGHVFFAERTAGMMAFAIRRLDLGGGTTLMYPLYRTPVDQSVTALGAAGGWLFFSTETVTFRIAQDDPAQPASVPPHKYAPASVRALVGAAEGMYFAASTGDAPEACPSSRIGMFALEAEEIPTGITDVPGCVSMLALDEDWVYWANGTTIGKVARLR